MKKLIRRLGLCLMITVVAAAAQPTISSLSSPSVSLSSRLIIHGSGFLSSQGSGHVEIAGFTASLTRWTDTLIAVYVPEVAPKGTANVQVFTSTGAASNVLPVGVTPRAAQGRIPWRFKADADYIQSRPAVGADGTVYAIDVSGHVYALSPNGGLRWIFNATGTGFGNVTVGPGGTVYVASTTAIFALRKNGTLRWQFNQNPAAFILLGPNVGPDGNVYAVGTEGMGVFSLTSAGVLRWSVPESYDRPIVILQEIVFSPAQSRLYFHANNHLRGVGLDGSQIFMNPESLSTAQGDPQPSLSPDGTLYTNTFTAAGAGLALSAFDSSGSKSWSIFDQFSNSTNILSTPEVGPDGVIYDGRNLSELYALTPAGSVRWKHTDAGILFAPVASPKNDQLFLGGIVTYGQAGFFEGVSTAGKSLWQVTLPWENGGFIVPMSRARFSADGRTAYIGTSIPGQRSADPYSYLYSVRTTTP